jgi:hypothetical protein
MDSGCRAAGQVPTAATLERSYTLTVCGDIRMGEGRRLMMWPRARRDGFVERRLAREKGVMNDEYSCTD